MNGDVSEKVLPEIFVAPDGKPGNGQVTPQTKQDLARIPMFNISPLGDERITLHGKVRPGCLWQYILAEFDGRFYLMPLENVVDQLGKQKADEIPVLYNLW